MTANRMHDVRSPQKTRTPESHAAKPSQFQMDTASVVDLQRVIGNQAVQRLLMDSGIQAKLTVGAADDAYEREADTVAAQVMSSSAQAPVQRAGEEDELAMKRMPTVLQRAKLGEDPEEMMAKRDVQRAAEEDELAMKRVQREGPEDELAMKRVQREGPEDELAMKRDVQREAQDMSDSFDVSSDIEQQIESSSGGGQAMPEQATNFFADNMGHDFSNVNVHTDSNSDALNRSIGARAFTTGNDVYFRSGEYSPDTSAGQQLLAHELTHVVQQTGGAPVKPKRDDNDCDNC